MDAEHALLGSISRQKVGEKMVCVRPSAEPNFGQHWAVVGALLTPEGGQTFLLGGF